MNISRFPISLLIAFIVGLMPMMSATAQQVPATPVPGSAPVGILAEFDIRELASPHAEVWFMRAGLEPDGVLPLGVQTGQTVLYVESGSLTVEADGVVFDADRNMVDATMNEPIAVDVAGSIMLVRDTEARVTNPSDVPATFLVLMMYSALDEEEGGGNMEEPVGLTQTGLSIGGAEFPPLRATLVMERVVVEPGESLQNVSLSPQSEGPDPGWMGIDLGTIETGSADIAFEQTSYQNITWPVMTGDEFPQPDKVLLTGTTSLDEGESYASYGSVLTFTNTSDQPLTILRVIVSPAFGL